MHLQKYIDAQNEELEWLRKMYDQQTVVHTKLNREYLKIAGENQQLREAEWKWQQENNALRKLLAFHEERNKNELIYADEFELWMKED